VSVVAMCVCVCARARLSGTRHEMHEMHVCALCLGLMQQEHRTPAHARTTTSRRIRRAKHTPSFAPHSAASCTRWCWTCPVSCARTWPTPLSCTSTRGCWQVRARA
jgi:hypothetical protein